MSYLIFRMILETHVLYAIYRHDTMFLDVSEDYGVQLCGGIDSCTGLISSHPCCNGFHPQD